MTISERILKVLKDRNMTQAELAKQVGIATSTISEWKKRKPNPTADKIMDICNVLQITPEQLLTGKGIEDEENINVTSRESCFTPYDIQLVQDYHGLKEEQQKRLMAYMEALKNIKRCKLEDRITLIYQDALNVRLDDTFDLIFIDAAKAQSQKFFELFEKNLTKDGYIITDNMYFHGLVNKNEKEIESRNVRGIVRKIKDYITFLKNNENYETVIHDIGDGIAVSKKKER